MTEDTALKFVGAHPPAFTIDEAVQIAEQHFGISGTLEPLWGERDQNFKISSGDHGGYVLKISNDREDAAAIDFQIKALQHLAENAPAVCVPQVMPLLSGQPFGQIPGKDGVEHLIHVVTLLDGVTLSQVDRDQDSLSAVGAQAGAAAAGMRGFFHAAAGQEMFWDIRHLGKYSSYISHISDAGLRRTITEFMSSFC